MVHYRLNSKGQTVDQYGRVFEFVPPTPRQRRAISNRTHPRKTFVRLTKSQEVK